MSIFPQHVSGHGRGTRRMDRMPQTVHQSQPVLRHAGTEKEKGTTQPSLRITLALAHRACLLHCGTDYTYLGH